MNVGELFVSIGVKGADKSVADLLSVQEGLEGTAVSSRHLGATLADLGFKGSDKTVAGLLGMQNELEATTQDALATKAALAELEEAPLDESLTLMTEMRDSLNEIALASGKASKALGDVKPKDSEKTKNQLDGYKKGLKEVSSLSLEAKAAIIAAIYALERLFSTSGKKGTDLANASAALGVSPKTLQQYQYVANVKGGISKDETTGVFGNLSSLATQILTGQARPIGLSRIGEVIGKRGLDLSKILLAAQTQNRPEWIIQALQEYAKNETNLGLRNQNLQSFGISPAMTALLAKGGFNDKDLANAPTLSEGQVQGMNSAREAGAVLTNSVDMAVDKFTAAHGAELVKDITPIIGAVTKLAEAFTKLAENVKVFEAFKLMFEGWAVIIQGLTSAVGLLGDASSQVDAKTGKKIPVSKADQEQADFLAKWIGRIFYGVEPPKEAPAKATKPGATVPAQENNYQKILKTLNPTGGAGVAAGSVAAIGGITPEVIDQMARLAAAPKMPVGIGAGGAPSQSVNVNQTLHFQHPGTDAKKTGDSVKKAVGDAYRSISAQVQGS